MPHIAVIVVNWNGSHLLRTCLGSLRAQTNFKFALLDAEGHRVMDSPVLAR